MVITPAGIDRQYYEFCALSELKGALRSGDIWVKSSRRYKNFDDYLIPEKDFDKLTLALPLPVPADYHEYITSRMTLLQSRLEEVNTMAALVAFCSRIRDLHDKKRFIKGKLAAMVSTLYSGSSSASRGAPCRCLALMLSGSVTCCASYRAGIHTN